MTTNQSITFEEAKQRVEQARSSLTKQQAQVSEAERKVLEAKKSLPDVLSQRALRGQKYGSGLQGRQIRRSVIKAKEELSKRLGAIKKYKTELAKYEASLQPYEQRIKRVVEGKSKIKLEIEKSSQKLKEAQERYERELKKAQEYSLRKRRKYPEKSKEYKEWYNKTKEELERELDEKEAFYRGYINKLKWGLGAINSGKNYDPYSVLNYAKDYGEYKRRKEEAKYENRRLREKFNKQLKEQQEAINKSKQFFSIVEYGASGKPEKQYIYTEGFKTKIAEFKLDKNKPYNVIQFNNKTIDFRRPTISKDNISKDLEKQVKNLPRVDRFDFNDFLKKRKNIDFGGGIFPLVSASSEIHKENLPMSIDLKKATGKPTSFITGAVTKGKEVINNLKGFSDLSPKFSITTPSGVITSTYPIGAGGTAIISPLTLEQEKKLREAQEKGSLKGTIKLIGSGLAAASKNIGKVVGYVTETKVHVAPQIIEKSLNLPEVSVGQVVRKGRETLPKIGEYAEKGVGQFIDWTKIKQTRTIPSQKKQIYLHETMMNNGETPTKLKIPKHEELTPAGFFGKVTGKAVRYAPEALAYYFGGGYMLGADVITGSEKLKTLEEDYKKELNKQYELQKQKLIEQGYSEKEIPTKEEFEKKYGSQIKKDMEKNIALWDIGLPLALLGASGIGKIVRKISKPKIEFEALNIKTPEKSLEIIGKPSAVVYSPSAKKQATIYENILAFSQEGKSGRKTIIKNFLGDELFSGVPYGKEGSEAYKKGLKFLIKKGYTKTQAKKIMRLWQPELKRNIFEGTALVVEGEEGTLIKLLGTEKSKPLLIEVKGVKTRQPSETIKFIKVLAKSVGKKKGIELYKFASKIEKAFLTKEGRPFTKLSQAGKTTIQLRGISGVKKVGEVDLLRREIKTGILRIRAKGYNVYQGADMFKQTIPKKRGVSISKGLIFAEKGEPEIIINLDELLRAKGISRIGSGGKKSSQYYLKQLYSPEQTTQKLTSALKEVTKKPKVSKITGKTTLKTPTKQDYGILPLVSASTTQKPQSQYYGTGMYERTESYGAGVPSAQPTSIKLTSIQPIRLGSLSVSAQRFKQPTKVGQIPRLQSKTEQKHLAGIKTEQINRLSLRLRELQLSKQKSFLRTILDLKQKQAQELLQKQPTIQTTQKATPKEPQPKPKPKEPEPKLIPLIESSKTIREKQEIKRAKEKVELFKAFVRKKGKDILLGEFETLGEAKRGLRKELLGTLRASGFIKKGGKKVRLNLGWGFRPSKKDAFRVVQKKTLRFGTRGETKEAQFFRKKKGRKIKFI